MRENGSTESQLKNEEFKKQIRSRLKADYMRRVRNEFLKIEENSLQRKSFTDLESTNIEGLTGKPPTQYNLILMNRVIINTRDTINQVQYKCLLLYVKFNFLDFDPAELLEKVELNDLIALFSNVLAIPNYYQNLVQEINPELVMKKLLTILEKAPTNTGSLVLWVLFQLIQIFPRLPLEEIGQLQGQLTDRFSFKNIYLTYLLCTFAENRPDLIDPAIIDDYTRVITDEKTEFYYFENLIIIFGMFVMANGDSPQTQKILKWAGSRLISMETNSPTKSSLLKLINHIIKSNISLSTLKEIIYNPPIVYEIIQRSLYDSQSENKLVCIDCLNQFVKLCPKMQLEDLLENYPSIIQSIASSLALLNLNVVVASLGSIGKIIMLRPEDSEIRRMLCDRGFKTELESLQYSKNQQISNMATILLEEYIQ